MQKSRVRELSVLSDCRRSVCGLTAVDALALPLPFREARLRGATNVRARYLQSKECELLS